MHAMMMIRKGNSCFAYVDMVDVAEGQEMGNAMIYRVCIVFQFRVHFKMTEEKGASPRPPRKGVEHANS